jgi:hypothetical protein
VDYEPDACLAESLRLSAAASDSSAGKDRGGTRVSSGGMLEPLQAWAIISRAWPASGGVITVAANRPLRTQA